MELIRLDRYLGDISTPFLTTDRLTHLDCYILPKLHTIRIALAALKGYEIPKNLHNLWAYMKRGYATEAFRKSCPSDQVMHFFIVFFGTLTKIFGLLLQRIDTWPT